MARMSGKNRQIRRQQFFPLSGELLKIPDQTFRGREIPCMVILDIGHHGKRRTDRGMGAVAFIGFAYENFACPGGPGKILTLKLSSDQESGCKTGLPQDMDDHGCNAGFAVRTGNCDDAGKERGSQSERFTAQNARCPAAAGFLQFGIVGSDCRTVNYQQTFCIRCIGQVFRPVSAQSQVGP